jgi:hypothetical protein
MSTFTLLPDDLLILICQYVEMQDIFHLRQTTPRLATFVLSNIVYISPSIARNTFPTADLLLRVPEGGIPNFLWLKSLVPKFLAAVLIDKYRLVSPHIHVEEFGIPAETEWGDVPRARIETGWRVLKQLSDISREVYRLPESHIPKRPSKEKIKRTIRLQTLSASRNAIDLVEQREGLILRRRLAYLNDLDGQAIVDYSLMFELLCGAFKTNHDSPSARFAHTDISKYNGADVFDWVGATGKRLWKADSWVNWYLLNQGPILFWHQWRSRTEEHGLEEVMLSAWKERSSRQVEIERNAASRIGENLSSLSKDEHGNGPDVLELFRSYFVYKFAHLQAGDFSPPKEILEDLPFFVDFRTR